ncbi:hypothetical protein ROR02_07270 [Pararhodospirillum oryzae]|uniref:Sulfotransferase family protein n=2 Tax=Pararhodospirillum oryzae TaxID=478448 RepID=A0A512H553_9PROT|nr:hypothetical protein ROR02_07270 [Pararhodospirillum oryzae]
MPRSGTTLLSVLLDRHPRVMAPPEPWLLLALDSLGQIPPRHPAGAPLIGEGFAQFLTGIDRDALTRSLAVDLYNQKLAQQGADLFVDKTPRYHMLGDRLESLFPNARQIVLLRNPFSILASFKSSWDFDILNDRPAGRRLALYTDLAVGLRRLAEQATTPHPRRLVMRYEDLVRDTAGQMARLFEFLDLDAPVSAPDAPLEAPAAYRASALGDQKILSTKRVHADSLDVWRTTLTREEKQAGLALWGADLLHRLGYGETLAQAQADGAQPPPEELAALQAQDFAADEATRLRDCLRTSRMTPGVDELLVALDTAYAEPRTVHDQAVAIADLRERLADALREAAQRLQLLHEADLAAQDLRNDKKAVLAELGKAQVAFSDLAATRAELNATRAETQAEIKRLREGHERLKGENAFLSDRLQAEMAHGEDLEADVAYLKGEVERLRRFITELQGGRLLGRYMRLRGIKAPFSPET